MKYRTKTAISSAALMLLLSGAAASQERPSPYLQLGLGASFLEGLSLTGPSGATTSLNENVGGVGTAALGYAFGNGFRTEFEFGYRSNDAKNVTLPGGGTTPTALNLKANAVALSYMVNGLYDLNMNSRWTPHVGVGVGATNVRVSNVGHATPFAWQAMAGVEYAVAPNLRLGLDYKFLGTDSLKLTNAALNVQSRSNYYDHAVILALRWKFGVSRPPIQPAAAVVAAPPPPPPPPAPLPTYTVYFETNSATLTPEAREIVRQAASSAQRDAVTRVLVTGYTDTVGSAAYNQGLSERRAASVRGELVAAGVAAAAIVTAGRGETELAVPTAQGINEPRNRRVFIVGQGPGS
jgi:OmpA-OmpF porin, OOP family